MNLESIDLYDPKTQENWFPAYRALHEHAPVYRIPGSDTYVICKYEDVLAVIRDPETFSNQPEIHGGEQLLQIVGGTHTVATYRRREIAHPRSTVALIFAPWQASRDLTHVFLMHAGDRRQ